MNKEERIQYVLDNIKDNIAVNIALSLVEECDELQQENKQLKEDRKVLFEENYNKQKVIIQQSKIIDKAIEYINALGTQEGMIKDYKIDKWIKNDLLEILKGEDNE